MNQWHKDLKSKQQETSRIRVIFWLTTMIFLIILGRTFYLQINQSEFLSDLAEKKNEQLYNIPVQRGNILTADGKLLAISLPVFSVFADPSEISNPLTTAQKIAPILDVEENYLVELLARKNKFVWLKRFLKNSQKQEIDKLDEVGIGIRREFNRIYPAQNYLSSIIGFSSNYGKGLEGIELLFDKHLSTNKTIGGFWDEMYGTRSVSTHGGSVKLTINDAFQHVAEKNLTYALDRNNAKNGKVLIVNTKTGAILAASDLPKINPNVYNLYKRLQTLNPFVGKIYEPGSTFKLITVAIALDVAVMNSKSTYNCHKGSHVFFGQRIRDTRPLGLSNISDIISYSSNICAAQIGLEIPSQDFYERIKRFGFLKKTNIEMLGEVSGRLNTFEKWRRIDQAILSYGHGIGVTPLQLIMAVNVIANDGIYVAPYIIKEMRDSFNQVLPIKQKDSYQVIKKSTASLINSYMQRVIEEGTGRLAKISGLKLAGKSGTTQKFDFKLNRYSDSNYILSFVGFFPAENPQYTILVILNEPKVSRNGSTNFLASSLFKKIVVDLVRLEKPIARKKLLVNKDTNTKSIFSSN